MFSMSRFAPVVLMVALAACSGPALEEPMMEAEMVGDVETIPPSPRAKVTGPVRAGILTAGDIDDALNLNAFRRVAAQVSREFEIPNPAGGQVVALNLVGPSRAPAPGVRVTLRRPGATEPFYDGYSGVGGRVAVFPALYGARNLTAVEMRAFSETGQTRVLETVSLGRSVEIVLPFEGTWEPDFLDLALVVDTTGSMADELEWLTRDLFRIVEQARKIKPDVDIRYGLIVYRDQGDEYVVRNYGFTKNRREMRDWLRGEKASGGGDYPEAAAQALGAAVDLNWRRGKGERLVFHIADAPPHREDAGRYLQAVREAAGKGVQVFGLGASGVALEAEYLMRQAAVATGGRYIFLTGDSGVGQGHAEPTVSCYRMTSLSGLVRRVLMSELSGRRFEAVEQDVLREVGSYRAGRCFN
ncbi:MAG: VWA domain-containing protein [Silicimonas sp.]|nr:VWA domain-containing protein [Silicimonas sp.]